MKRPKTIRRTPIRAAAAYLADTLAKLRSALAGLTAPPAYAQPQLAPVRAGATHRRAVVATLRHDGALQ